MSDEKINKNFQKICRICMKISNNMMKISTLNIIDMFLECTNVQIWIADDLPQQICKICFKKLQNAFNLKHQSEETDKELRHILNNFDNNIKNDKENIKNSESSTHNIISDFYLDNNSSLCDSVKNEESIQNEAKKDNLKCDICHKQFLNKHKLKKHLVAHSNVRPYRCDQCPKAFKEKFILNKHLKTIHTDVSRRKICQTCGRSIVKTSFERHLKTHENPPSYQCTACTKKFLAAEILEKHFRRVHKKETSFELYPFLCNQCGKGLISKSELKRHMNSHLKEASFKCTNCGKAYTSHAGLRSHIKVFHLNERPFNCTICSRAFPTKIILKHHMRTHTGEKPFNCLICSKTFALKCVLQTHMKIHN